ncbi:hypothetical protein Aduo_004494 [Ancylostoma duodenale]
MSVLLPLLVPAYGPSQMAYIHEVLEDPENDNNWSTTADMGSKQETTGTDGINVNAMRTVHLYLLDHIFEQASLDQPHRKSPRKPTTPKRSTTKVEQNLYDGKLKT